MLSALITLLLQAYLFQGVFSHWTDGQPVTHTSWYRPTVNCAVFDMLVHNLQNDVYTKHILVQNLKYRQIAEQPEMSHTKNCTALVLIRSTSGNFPMITIPCNSKHNTQVFCQLTNRPFVLR